MADLDPLIRYRKHQLEEKQKFLAALYKLAEELLTKRTEILDQIEKEKQALNAEDMAQMGAFSGFGNFLQASKNKINGLQNEEQKLDTRIQIAINDMRNSFGELKKIEITHERRIEAERKKLDARETAIFEEIGLQIYAKDSD